MDSNKRSKEFHCDLKEAYFPAIKTEEIWNTTIGEELRKASIDSGSMMALVQVQDDGSLGRAWTYEELYKDCLELAKRMSSRHKKGTRVAVWAPNYPEWVIIEFAASIAGLVLVTVNPSFQEDELKYVLEKSQSEELYVAKSFRGNPMWDIAKKVTEKMPSVKRMVDIQDWDELFGLNVVAVCHPLIRFQMYFLETLFKYNLRLVQPDFPRAQNYIIWVYSIMQKVFKLEWVWKRVIIG